MYSIVIQLFKDHQHIKFTCVNSIDYYKMLSSISITLLTILNKKMYIKDCF